MARLKAPVGMSSFNHAGSVYEIGEDGHVEVPSHIICEQVLSHGLTVAPDAPPPKKEGLEATGDNDLDEAKRMASAGAPLITDEQSGVKNHKPTLKK